MTGAELSLPAEHIHQCQSAYQLAVDNCDTNMAEYVGENTRPHEPTLVQWKRMSLSRWAFSTIPTRTQIVVRIHVRMMTGSELVTFEETGTASVQKLGFTHMLHIVHSLK